MELTSQELNWVKDRLLWYDIPYQEIFDELTDHILSAMEAKRAEGNRQDVKIVFQQVMDEHFGGFMGLEKIAAQQADAYRSKVKRLIWLNFKQQFNWQAKLFIGLMFLAGFVLPYNKIMDAVLIAVFTALSSALWFYSQWRARHYKAQKGKKLLAQTFITLQGLLPTVVVNAILYLPNLHRILTGGEKFTYRILALHPSVLTTLVAVMLVYFVACIRANQQEFKLGKIAL